MNKSATQTGQIQIPTEMIEGFVHGVLVRKLGLKNISADVGEKMTIIECESDQFELHNFKKPPLYDFILMVKSTKVKAVLAQIHQTLSFESTEYDHEINVLISRFKKGTYFTAEGRKPIPDDHAN